MLPSRGRAQGSKARQYARTQGQSHRCSHHFELVFNLFSFMVIIFQMVFMEFGNICCCSPLVPIPLRGPLILLGRRKIGVRSLISFALREGQDDLFQDVWSDPPELLQALANLCKPLKAFESPCKPLQSLGYLSALGSQAGGGRGMESHGYPWISGFLGIPGGAMCLQGYPMITINIIGF